MFETMTDEEILAALKEGKRHEGVLEQLREEAANDGKDKGMTEDVKQLTEAKAQADKELADMRREVSVRDTRDAVVKALAESKLPDVAKERIRETFADKAFEKDEDRTKEITEAIQAETDYVGKIGGPAIKGMGSSGDTGGKDQLKETYKTRFLREGKSEDEAEKMASIAVEGR